MGIAVVFTAGCATPMALRTSTSAPIMNGSTGLVVLVAETQKAGDLGGGIGAGATPTIQSIEIARAGSSESMKFVVDNQLIISSTNAMGWTRGNVYTHLLSFSLPEGDYEIRRIGGTANYRKGFFSYNPHVRILSVGGKAVYGGNLVFLMRRTMEGETSIGIVRGLKDLVENAVIGFNEATFDLAIGDQQENDMKLFRKKFLQTEKMDFLKRLALPVQVREKATASSPRAN